VRFPEHKIYHDIKAVILILFTHDHPKIGDQYCANSRVISGKFSNTDMRSINNVKTQFSIIFEQLNSTFFRSSKVYQKHMSLIYCTFTISDLIENKRTWEMNSFA
jgi:hypothetical protein